MVRRPVHVAFDGEPPDVKAGDTVWCRDAFGRWRQTTALPEPRYDEANALNWQCHLTVQIADGALDGGPCNWPAEDVRTSPPPEEAGDGARP